MKAVTKAGTVVLGMEPRVVGTIITREFLAGPAQHARLPCDLVELRLDGIENYPRWAEAGKAIEANGTPVFATVRFAQEGGLWKLPDSERLPILLEALENVSGIDVELHSEIAENAAENAQKKGKLCIISFHDFQKTPPRQELESIIRRAQEIGSVVKIAAMVQSPGDLQTFRDLLAVEWKTPLCLIGMGPLGRETRLNFPRQGSCLTYGYLDQPGAPGQYSAEELCRHLHHAQ